MEYDYDVDEDDDEGVEDSRNELPTQISPQTPNNRRSRNICSNKCNVTPRRMVNAKPNMTKAEAIKILDANRDCSGREVKVKHSILAIKHHPDKWNKRCCFTT